MQWYSIYNTIIITNSSMIFFLLFSFNKPLGNVQFLKVQYVVLYSDPFHLQRNSVIINVCD